jgi:hypothetical protein
VIGCDLLFVQQIWPILLSKMQFAAAAAIFLPLNGGISCRWGCNEYQQTAYWSIITKKMLFDVCSLSEFPHDFNQKYTVHARPDTRCVQLFFLVK